MAFASLTTSQSLQTMSWFVKQEGLRRPHKPWIFINPPFPDPYSAIVVSVNPNSEKDSKEAFKPGGGVSYNMLEKMPCHKLPKLS